MPPNIWNVSWGADCRGDGVHTEQCTYCVLRARLQWGLVLQHRWVLLQTPWFHCSFNFDLLFSHSGAKKPGIITKVPMAPFSSTAPLRVMNYTLRRWVLLHLIPIGRCIFSGFQVCFQDFSLCWLCSNSGCLGSLVVLLCQFSGSPIPLLY